MQVVMREEREEKKRRRFVLVLGLAFLALVAAVAITSRSC